MPIEILIFPNTKIHLNIFFWGYMRTNDHQRVFQKYKTKGAYHWIFHAVYSRKNSLIECFFSLKAKCVWQRQFQKFGDAARTIKSWMNLYNQERPNQIWQYRSFQPFCREQGSPVACSGELYALAYLQHRHVDFLSMAPEYQSFPSLIVIRQRDLINRGNASRRKIIFWNWFPYIWPWKPPEEKATLREAKNPIHGLPPNAFWALFDHSSPNIFLKNQYQYL